MRLALSPVRRLLGAAFGTLLALSSMSAWADFQSDVTVKLFAPGGPLLTNGTTSASQTVAVADLATGLSCCTGDVAANMLTGERVFFVGDSIRVRSFSGTDAFTTGYLGAGGVHARYEFDGLSIAGKTIIGFTAYAFDDFLTGGFSGLASPLVSDLVHRIGDTISLDLDSILFVDRGTGSGSAYADFRIDLITQDTGPGGGGNLPEPATLALFVVAALGAGAARRRA